MAQVKIRLRLNIFGTFHNIEDPKRGDVIEVNAADAERYYADGIAQPASVKELGPRFKPYVV